MINKRIMGRTGLKVSELCLGTLNFGWKTDEKTSFAILDAFVAAGGTFLDFGAATLNDSGELAFFADFRTGPSSASSGWFAGSSGKSSVFLDATASVSSAGKAALFLDANALACSSSGSALFLDGSANLSSQGGDVLITGKLVSLDGGGAQAKLDLDGSGATLAGSKIACNSSGLNEITGSVVKIN